MFFLFRPPVIVALCAIYYLLFTRVIQPNTIATNFNAIRCIELHNRIVNHGLSQLSPTARSKIPVQRNWFTVYNISATSNKLRFPPPVTKFFEEIDIVTDRWSFSFLPILRGIARPRELRGETAGPAPENNLHWGRFDDSIVLYREISDPDNFGLVLNLENGLVTWLWSWHEDLKLPGKKWMKLEDVLEKYWGWVENGMFYVEEGFERGGDNLGSNGWKERGWVEEGMSETLSRWTELVEAVEKRMGLAEGGEPREALMDRNVAEDLRHIPPFMRKFLARAIRPRFTFVAPGLRVPDAEYFVSMNTWQEKQNRRGWFPGQNGGEVEVLAWRYSEEDLDHADNMDKFPGFAFPLFPTTSQGLDFGGRYDERGFRYNFIIDDWPGLYVTHSPPFADGVNLLLPYGIGGNGYVLEADGSTFRTPYIHSNNALYGHGRCSFLPKHSMQLKTVLKHWLNMVQMREWGVGRDGVKGSIKTWKDADSAFKHTVYKADFECR